MPKPVLISGREFVRFESFEKWEAYAEKHRIKDYAIDSPSFPCLVCFVLDAEEKPVPFFIGSEDLEAMKTALAA